jgi:hypothetical protein
VERRHGDENSFAAEFIGQKTSETARGISGLFVNEFKAGENLKHRSIAAVPVSCSGRETMPQECQTRASWRLLQA